MRTPKMTTCKKCHRSYNTMSEVSVCPSCGTTNICPDFDYASPILDFSIFRGQNRHFCPRLVSFEHQTRA